MARALAKGLADDLDIVNLYQKLPSAVVSAYWLGNGSVVAARAMDNQRTDNGLADTTVYISRSLKKRKSFM